MYVPGSALPVRDIAAPVSRASASRISARTYAVISMKALVAKTATRRSSGCCELPVCQLRNPRPNGEALRIVMKTGDVGHHKWTGAARVRTPTKARTGAVRRDDDGMRALCLDRSVSATANRSRSGPSSQRAASRGLESCVQARILTSSQRIASRRNSSGQGSSVTGRASCRPGTGCTPGRPSRSWAVPAAHSALLMVRAYRW